MKQVEPTNIYRKKPRNDELRFCTFGSGQLTFICRIVCYLHTEHISFYRLVSKGILDINRNTTNVGLGIYSNRAIKL